MRHRLTCFAWLAATALALSAPVAIDDFLTFQPPAGWLQQKSPEYWGSPEHDAALHVAAVPGASQMLPEGEKKPLSYFAQKEKEGATGWKVIRSGTTQIAGEPAEYFEATAQEEDGRINSQSFFLCLHKDRLVELQIKFRHAANPESAKQTRALVESIRWK